MPNNTLVNARSPVTQKSNGTVITGPDVCKTPVGAAVVPIPYPNISKSSDLAKGSKNVKINGAPVCLKDSEFSTSTGDEAGTLKGLISSTNKGKAHPVLSSFDVKVEGKGVVRNTDPFFGNNHNAPPAPVMQAQVVLALMPPPKDKPCSYCKKAPHEFSKKAGTSAGSGPKLRKKIIAEVEDHPWYTGKGSLQAHHLIPTAQVLENDWPTWCAEFGYDINRKENGVMLPGKLNLACQLHVPLHISKHDSGRAGATSYPGKVRDELDIIGKDIRAGKFCDNPQALVDKMDNLSKLILQKIDKFRWTITRDGRDYAPGQIGCAGVDKIPMKTQAMCPHSRQHRLTPKGSADTLQQKVKNLEVGK